MNIIQMMAFPLFRRLILIFHFLHCILTIQVVNRCPNSVKAWTAKSKEFSCHITEMYHCLRNDQDNLVELCSTVKLFPNNQGCPILSNISGISVINTRRCLETADPAGCPEHESGMYFTYETFKYPSCIEPMVRSEVSESSPFYDLDTKCSRLIASTEAEGTTPEGSIHNSSVNVHSSNAISRAVMCMTFVIFAGVTGGFALIMMMKTVYYRQWNRKRIYYTREDIIQFINEKNL